MLDRRFQVLLDDETHRRLAAEARARGMSVAALIREAIDRTFPATSPRKLSALKRILAAPTMSVPEPDELRIELDELRGRRG